MVQQKAAAHVEWRLEMHETGVRFTRYDDGALSEAYGTVPPAKAAVYAVAITQGFEPPRGLVRQETRAGQTRPAPDCRPAS